MATDNNKAGKTRKYRFSLIDAATHERLWTYSFSRTGIVIAGISAVVLLVTGIFCLVAFTPMRTFIPGYPDAHSKRQAVQNVLRIDSLETRILQWELYTENLRKVVAGEPPIRLDSLILQRQAAVERGGDPAFLAGRDSLLRAEVAGEEQFGVSGTPRTLPIEAVSFFTPLKGVVSQGFDRALHPYIDITAPANSVVMAVLDGAVVFSGWDDAAGYTVAVQHAGDILSIYKHNQKLLHGIGDRVKAGTPIALVGNSGSLTTGDHLHFELWYKGEAVDPAQYINF
ncbi:MAG: M23 family metallopeptidase [Bacteroidales bacterium]|nr:M23 family metallopeptidase [Bacteroidales bacterium]